MSRISPVIEPEYKTSTSFVLPDIKNRNSAVAASTGSSSGTDLSKMRRVNKRAILMLSSKMKAKPNLITAFSTKFKSNLLSPLS